MRIAVPLSGRVAAGGGSAVATVLMIAKRAAIGNFMVDPAEERWGEMGYSPMGGI
jgi:hypothetical protein